MATSLSPGFAIQAIANTIYSLPAASSQLSFQSVNAWNIQVSNDGSLWTVLTSGIANENKSVFTAALFCRTSQDGILVAKYAPVSSESPSGGSSFDPTANQTISGQWTFTAPIVLNGWEVNSAGALQAVTLNNDLKFCRNLYTRNASFLSIDDSPAAGGYRAIAFTNASIGIVIGSGIPTIIQPKGSLYLRIDGSSSSTRLYVNTDGSTGWTPVTTVS